MPYVTNSDLSHKISEKLPEHAQTIFRKAFNSAYEQYAGDEEIAFRIAWSAVKKKYEKNEDGIWVEKKSLSSSNGSSKLKYKKT
ncbi:ChaB family protein [Candidatus Dependentiae bacterium]|nr:ChaB family protein [Candidatus Dependentiae bacterium]